jgi:chemotaxis response regulator CheB
MNSWRWLALGASTGGPAALHDLLGALPEAFSLRVLIVQHIAAGSELDLAAWLASSLGLDVRAARDGERPPPGTVRVAPAGAHLRVAGDGRLTLDEETPPRSGHRPSVDELYLSLAVAAPRETAAVLLTGMGSDGAAGLLALRRAGAFCLAQDEASSVVFGMPRAALEMGAAELALPPRALGLELARRLARAA